MRCPFPDCLTQSPNSPDAPDWLMDHVGNDVFLCRTCGRLVFRCVAEACQALNRPFSRFCRCCGESQHPGSGPTARKRWEEVQRFDFDWMFPIVGEPFGQQSTTSHAPPAATSSVLELGTIQGSRLPKVLIEWAFIDGLLAIHQGAGFLALAHPFGDLAESPHASALIWTRPEADLLRQHEFELPYGNEQRAEMIRPFPPMATADRKFAIFSTKYSVITVELASLPGWHYRSEPRASVVWFADSSLEILLAAPPVLLTPSAPQLRRPFRHAPDPIPNVIGLLLQDSTTRSYFWRVVSLDEHSLAAGVTEANGEELINHGSPLPIHGQSAQILGFQDEHLVFATPEGHWLWSSEDARRGDDSKLVSLPARNGEVGEIVLDAEIQTRSIFSWRYQHLLRKREPDRMPHRADAARQHFELCYARLQSGHYAVEWRNIWPGDPEGTSRSIPQRIFSHDQNARPLGDCALADDASVREMLFLVGSAGELYRRPITGDLPRPLVNLQTGQLDEIHGLRFYDPLLVVVREDATPVALKYAVELRSLRYPNQRAIANAVSLKADPLPWSNFLFTCEGTADGLAVIRREYSVASSSSGHAPDQRVFASRKSNTPRPKESVPSVRTRDAGEGFS